MSKIEEDEETRIPGPDECVVVAPRPGVQVYINPKNMIVIRNFGDAYRDDDDMNYTLIHGDDVETVIKALLEARDHLRDQ